MNTKIAVLLTCHNRRDNTVKCIESLAQNPENIDMRFVVTDDKSEDGTVDALINMPYHIRVIEGNGNLYWGGGMRRSMAYALDYADKFDYVLLVNDDVIFRENAISDMLKRRSSTKCDVVVGATCDSKGKQTYGGVEKTSDITARFRLIPPSDEVVICDTFNCNCVLIPADIFVSIGNLDEHYIHSMGDYDYGMMIRKRGYTIVSSSEYVGDCDDNDDSGTWRDVTLPRRRRIELKEGPKGLPAGDWFHFIRKNYGLMPALYHSITPYIRILIGK